MGARRQQPPSLIGIDAAQLFNAQPQPQAKVIHALQKLHPLCAGLPAPHGVPTEGLLVGGGSIAR
jgi:hypothetical protein